MRKALLPLLLAAFVVSAACGGPAAPSDGGLDPHVFAVCASVMTPALPPSSSAAGGTFSSPSLDAVMCPGAASATIIPNTPSLMSVVNAPYFFLLTSPKPAGWGAPALAGFVVKTPSSLVSLELNLEVALPAPTPGTYQGVCGYVSTDVFFGVGVDCSGATGASCPTDCKASCATPPCAAPACVPQNPSQDGWLAASGTSCGDGWWTPRGAWTLKLDSVTEQDTSPGQVAYVPHGTFTATMPEADSAEPAPPLMVSFTF